MKLRIILFALISFPFLWSCDKKEIPVFASDDAGIYFQRLTNAVYGSTTEYYGDSTDFSFAGANAYYRSHMLYAPVLTMGKWSIMTGRLRLSLIWKNQQLLKG